ncbi:hypothetical protein RJ641_011035 [Dillenia turbinata]|uniref:F-box associated beta-propeller type 1 domain-containing protein n=1 Tax=Dillenia turbinata TaxID=194707 RepID=A0AAN8V331_9MAGN
MVDKAEMEHEEYQIDYKKVVEAIERQNKRKNNLEELVKKYVLPFLPAKSLARFKAVSKEWNQWISNPFLPHMQSNFFRQISGLFCQNEQGTISFISLDSNTYDIPQHSLNFMPVFVNLVSTCNGLLFCQDRFGGTYYVCSPVYREWKELPEPSYYHGEKPAAVLAFDPYLLNFEAHFDLICAFPLIDIPVICFEIYSSKTNSWRVSSVECLSEEGLDLTFAGFYMKGYAYWMTKSGNILVCDVKNEVFDVLPLSADSKKGGTLTEMYGELCYVCSSDMFEHECEIEIYGGLDMTLKLKIHLRLPDSINLVGECQMLPCINGETLILLVEGTIICYHVRDGRIQVLSRTGNSPESRYLPYVNSLVSLSCQLE